MSSATGALHGGFCSGSLLAEHTPHLKWASRTTVRRIVFTSTGCLLFLALSPGNDDFRYGWIQTLLGSIPAPTWDLRQKVDFLTNRAGRELPREFCRAGF